MLATKHDQRGQKRIDCERKVQVKHLLDGAHRSFGGRVGEQDRESGCERGDRGNPVATAELFT